MKRKWIISFGGVGMLPGMPGTYASLAAALLFYALFLLFGTTAYPVAAALIIISAALGHRLTPWAEEYFKKADPGHFVLDEVVGQLLTLLLVFLLALVLKPLGAHPLANVVAGFILFRAFDVSKPWPLRTLEKIHGGWGVLLDDVAGALYAAAALVIVIYLIRAMVGPDVYGGTAAALPLLRVAVN